MQYRTSSAVFIIVLWLLESEVNCHLKNIGEVTNDTDARYKIESRIVGGDAASLDQFPFNVKFLNLGGICGGTILTTKTVLTAAHCFDANTNTVEMRVYSNSRYMFDPTSRSHEVWAFFLHEKYNEIIKFSNDVAIIMITDSFEYGDFVQRAKLCTTFVWMNENEKSFDASGWGETNYGGKVSQKGLLKTHLHYISRDKCMEINRVTLSPDMFCLFGDGERDTCRGDSGGGIVWNGAIVGIVSHGNGCAKKPGIYTSVSYFYPWIQSTVEKLYNKFCILKQTGNFINLYLRIRASSSKNTSTLESKIVGGEPVKIESFPSSVVLFNHGALCGCCILNSWSVLTAAHCIDYNVNTEDMTIHAGSRHLYDQEADIYNVAEVVVHPDYNKKIRFACDIAVVFLAEPMEFGPKVKKATIVNTDKWMITGERNFEVTGWGLTKYGGQLSDMGLMMVQLRYVSTSDCARYHNRTPTADMFCLYGDAYKDACKGDSGGGVLWNKMIVGIVSHGDGCANKYKPSVYTNVWYFREWIENTVTRYFNKNCH